MPIKTPPTPEASREIATPHYVPHPRLDPARKACLLLLLCSLLTLLAMLSIAIDHLPNLVPTDTPCMNLLNATDYTQLVHLQPTSQQMSAVQMLTDLTVGMPSALVQVTTPSQHNTLDVYIFGCSLAHNQPHVQQIFSQHGLVQGSVVLTPEHTLLITALDTTLSPDDLALLQPLQENIYREYAWRAGHFAPVLFPAFYPVASSSEAQALQQSFNNGQQMPWHDPLATAQQMAKDLLQWSTTPSARLISQTGNVARVELTSQQPRMSIDVTLQQMIQSGGNGLWFVTDAHTPGISLTLSHVVTSPMHLAGTGALADGHTTATLFDHTLTPLSSATNVPLTVQPNGAFAGTLTYSGLLTGQQGLLLIESVPTAQSKESGQLLLTSVILK